MPALIVGINGRTGEPLGGKKDAIAVLIRLGKTLIAIATTDQTGVAHRQGPINFECNALSGL